ncbi:uncharacterized protein LOC131685388 isoform X2 [Topomyia yanbarensis]|uniref:uncharacterized protein LOC131685388 isoform X2 n=1 Tax=Topomyia yanbarensis TaxID=2498891 RepID=UPI00273B9E79|nr:uncharacterized protein LOC131685388 isoform X2 [Topomyia yanbarensis]
MAHLHLQLLVRRFNDLADSYLRQISWVGQPAVDSLLNLQRTILGMCTKQRFQSSRSLVFDDLEVEKDVLHFLRPVECCGLILFNLYVQTMADILVRYDNNYECVDQTTAEHLVKTRDYIDCILRKPVCLNTAARAFFIRTNFRKWKIVFDYTCHPCDSKGIKRCRFQSAIAWYMVHASSLAANAILHLESIQHAESLRGMPKDRVDVPPRPEINNNSASASYLLQVREMELDKKVAIGQQIARDTPFTTVETYLRRHLSKSLGGITIFFFGSRVTGLAESNADLDVCIKSRSGQDDITALRKTIAWAEDTGEVEIERMVFERPSFVRVNVRSLKLAMDLTFGSSYVVANSELIEYFLRLQPLASKLFFCLKEWKKLAEFTQNFHNHMLIMLIVFFMQQKQYLPPLNKLIIGPIVQNGLFNTKFRRNIDITQLGRPKDLLGLTRDFFAYWDQFDWTRYGICVLDGQVKPKESFRFETDRVSIPPMMSTDYFEQTRNTASNIKGGDYQKFVAACKEAAEVMKYKVIM